MILPTKIKFFLIKISKQLKKEDFLSTHFIQNIMLEE